MHWEVALYLSELFRWTIFVVQLGPFSLLQCLLFFDTFCPQKKNWQMTFIWFEHEDTESVDLWTSTDFEDLSLFLLSLVGAIRRFGDLDNNADFGDSIGIFSNDDFSTLELDSSVTGVGLGLGNDTRTCLLSSRAYSILGLFKKFGLGLGASLQWQWDFSQHVFGSILGLLDLFGLILGLESLNLNGKCGLGSLDLEKSLSGLVLGPLDLDLESLDRPGPGLFEYWGPGILGLIMYLGPCLNGLGSLGPEFESRPGPLDLDRLLRLGFLDVGGLRGGSMLPRLDSGLGLGLLGGSMLPRLDLGVVLIVR
jgi:hypothetical protein